MKEKNIKLLRIHLRVPPAPGGMETHILELTKQQRTHGIEVDIAFNDGDKSASNDIKILSEFPLYPKIKTPYCFFIFYLFLIFKLIINNKKYDIVHIHGDWSSYLFAPIIKKITGSKKVFFTFHGMLQNGYAHNKILPRTLSFCDLIFVTGYESFRKISKYSNAIFQPSGVRDHFFDPQLKKTNNEVSQAITTTFFRPQKNVKLILDIANQCPDVNFIIIGEGPEYKQIQSEIKNRCLINVSLLGQLPSTTLKEQLLKADFFLFTSLEEGTPTSVMEAMACGLPIISSNAGGIETLVANNINGFVVKNDFNDTVAYVNFIQILLSDKQLQDQIRENNIKKSNQFRWEVVSQKITEAMMENKS